MGDHAVEVVDVSKRFRMYRDRASSLKQAVTRLGRRSEVDEFWAVRNVSITVPKGSTFGLIGHNGSGKSTLLRLIAGIHRPTSGHITTEGRLAALLDLGAGFHPELTGRENVYLNGSILGLRRREIDERFDSIVEFAGLGDFIDAPVKVYSSGMYLRLGFSVAVHVEPEILIIDEVIAVGDEEFQRRCFEHIYDLRRKGSTILLVSHSHQLMQDLCDEVAWLDHGVLQQVGPAAPVLWSYLEQVDQAEGERRAAEATPPVEGGAEGEEAPTPARRGSGEIVITGVEWIDGSGEAVPVVQTGRPFTVRVHLRANEPVDAPVLGIELHHETGTHVAGVNAPLDGVLPADATGDHVVDYAVDALPLLPGAYLVSLALRDSHRIHAFDVHDRAYPLRVQHGSDEGASGLVDLGGTLRAG